MAGSGARVSKPAFQFHLSCDINLQVKVCIVDLLGTLPSFRLATTPLHRLAAANHALSSPPSSPSSLFPSTHTPGSVGSGSSHQHSVDPDPDSIPSGLPTGVHVVACLSAAEDVLGLECRTTYANSGPMGVAWSEWLTFCVKYRDLPHDTLLSFCVWEVCEGREHSLLGSTSMPMFNKKGRLKTGPQRLRVWEGVPPSLKWPTSTPGKVPLSARGHAGMIQHLEKLFLRGELPALEWLDSLAMEAMHTEEDEAAQRQYHKDRLLHPAATPPLQLVVDLPLFSHAVLYQQAATYTAAALGAKKEVSAAAAAAAVASGEKSAMQGIVVLHDPEVGRDNPAELKAQKLARSLTRGLIDRDLKPNSEERRQIQAVLKLPPNKPLHADERALLWRFRFSVTSESRALTKFLKCVDWSDVVEGKQATELMVQWVSIEIADAMELLSPDFRNEEVRSHAVSVLQQKDDDELMYYLLQLVQALRYESSDNSRLARFLVTRATANPTFAVMLHWYLFTEWEDPSFGPRASSVHASLVSALQAAPNRVWEAIRRQTDMVSQLNYIIKELKGSKVKASRATERLREMISETGPCGELMSCRLPLPLNPCLLLDGMIPGECMCFKSAQLPLCLTFRLDPHPTDWDAHNLQTDPHSLPHPTTPANSTTTPANSSSTTSHGHSRRTSISSQHNPHARPGQEQQQPPQHQDKTVAGRLAGLPARTGVVAAGGQLRCIMIYKKGDDLRQDQFILQMISLMDRLLKRENLDLRLTPYKVLPTSSDDGLVEYVPSQPLSKVLAEHRTIHKYLAQFQADPAGPFGLKMEAVETFVRSCAGYCVMTYILGVGDRHLDNLMLHSDGRLFHIDFGYILGHDPKPFPPPMKLCREMIEAMGGQDSVYYVQFRMYACEAYNILRKSADLILSLFHLMAGASIEAIRQDPEKAILKLQDKFRLDYDDEAAVVYMQQLINESATALMPQIVETTHRWAQYWR
ncbi:MAG: hypothetical protein WDW36_005643 [Sanguina aurantia]